MTRLQKSLVFFFIALFVFSLFRLALYLIYKDQFFSLATEKVLLAFLDGIRFDASIILTFFALPLFMMNLPLGFAKKKKWFHSFAWVIFASVFVQSFLLLCDIIYFNHVKRHITRELLTLSNDMGLMVSTVFSSYKLALTAFLVSALLLFYIWKKILALKLKNSQFALITFIIIIPLIILGIRGTVSRKPLTTVDAFRTGSPEYGNLCLNGVFSTVISLRKSTRADHLHFPEEQLYATLNLDQKEYPLLKNYQNKKTGYNIVFILLESWSYKYVDSFGKNNMGVTPFFDSMTKDGIKFTNFYAMGQRSIEAIQAVLTGIPILPGIPYIGYGLEVTRFSRIGKIAQRNGYSSLFVQSFRRRSYRMDSVSKLCGFDEYYGMEDIPIIYDYPDPKGSEAGWDYDSFMFLKKKIDNFKKPFIAFMFTGTTHGPFAALNEKFLQYPHHPSNEDGFLNMMYYSDWSLGEFMKEARASSWYDKTVFIFCADHALLAYEKFPFLKRCHIPFLIYAPKIFRPGVNKTLCSQLDIIPTIMDILGFQDEFAAWGEPVLSKKEDPFAIVTEGNIVSIITPEGYLRHSLKKRQDTQSFLTQPLSKEYLDKMEAKLLAIDQLTWELLRTNKWAK